MNMQLAISNRAVNKLMQVRQQRIIEKAANQAMQMFQKKYPKWASSLFDGTFLQGAVISPLLNGASLDKRQLTETYLNQFNYHSESMRQRHIEQTQPIILAFLKMLKKTLYGRQSGVYQQIII